MDGFPSGQRGQTVNLLAPPSKVRILLHPYFSFAAVAEQADAQDLKILRDLYSRTGSDSVCGIEGMRVKVLKE